MSFNSIQLNYTCAKNKYRNTNKNKSHDSLQSRLKNNNNKINYFLQNSNMT